MLSEVDIYDDMKHLRSPVVSYKTRKAGVMLDFVYDGKYAGFRIRRNNRDIGAGRFLTILDCEKWCRRHDGFFKVFADKPVTQEERESSAMLVGAKREEASIKKEERQFKRAERSAKLPSSRAGWQKRNKAKKAAKDTAIDVSIKNQVEVNNIFGVVKE